MQSNWLYNIIYRWPALLTGFLRDQKKGSTPDDFFKTLMTDLKMSLQKFGRYDVPKNDITD